MIEIPHSIASVNKNKFALVPTRLQKSKSKKCCDIIMMHDTTGLISYCSRGGWWIFHTKYSVLRAERFFNSLANHNDISYVKIHKYVINLLNDKDVDNKKLYIEALKNYAF